jgi:glycine/serine hydroxymethyltransferase
MATLANWMADVMDTVDKDGGFDSSVTDKVKAEVLELCKGFPVYDFSD